VCILDVRLDRSVYPHIYIHLYCVFSLSLCDLHFSLRLRLDVPYDVDSAGEWDPMELRNKANGIEGLAGKSS